MTSRDAILAAVRAHKPAPRSLPDVPPFDEGQDDNRLGRFASAFKAMGGTMIDLDEGDPLALIRGRVDNASVVVSMVPELAGNRVICLPSSSQGAKGESGILGLSLLSPQNDSEGAVTEPASLADVDIAVVRAAFGIAETGSVALTEHELGVNTLAYLAQHLIVLLDPAEIVVNLHHAYRRPEFKTARYCVFHTGPSATADIEGVLIHGAQGVRSLSILPLPRTP